MPTIQNLGRLILRLGWRVKVRGAEHVPATGPVIIAANHLGWLDGAVLLLSTRRPLRVLAKHEIWDGPLAPLVRSGGAIPIDWRNPDRLALKTSLDVLREGGAVGIFPEGTRCRGDFAWLRDGLSYLLTHEPVPVVPVAIFGTRPTGRGRDYVAPPGTKVDVVVGEAFGVEMQNGDATRRSASREIGLQLRSRLADHVASAAEIYGLRLPSDDVSRREDDRR